MRVGHHAERRGVRGEVLRRLDPVEVLADGLRARAAAALSSRLGVRRLVGALRERDAQQQLRDEDGGDAADGDDRVEQAAGALAADRAVGATVIDAAAGLGVGGAGRAARAAAADWASDPHAGIWGARASVSFMLRSSRVLPRAVARAWLGG